MAQILPVPVPVSATSLPLPSGAATAALQTQPGVDIGDVTINNASGASAVNVQDGGNSLTVDQSTGSNLHVVTDSGTITTVSTVTNLSQQGGVAISLNTGVRDTGTQRVTIATNDVVPVTDNSGSLTVDAPVGTPAFVRLSDGSAAISTLPVSLASVPSHAVTNAGVFVVQENGAALTSLQLIDDTIFTDDTSTHATGTTKGVGIMAAATPTDTAVNANDIGMVAMTTDRKLHVSVQDSIATVTNVATIGTSVTPGTAAANLGKAEDAAHTTGDVGVMALATANEANTARGADNDYCPIATDTEGNVRIVGNRDHDAVDAGEIVGVGMRAIAHGTNPTAVAAADRTAWYASRAGIPFVVGGHPNVVTLRANYTTAQTDAAIITISAGSKIVITRCSVTADNANTVDVAVRIGFGASATPSTTGVVLSHPGISAGSGVVEGVGAGILGIGADGEDLRITSEVPTTGSIDVVVSYYTVDS